MVNSPQHGEPIINQPAIKLSQKPRPGFKNLKPVCRVGVLPLQTVAASNENYDAPVGCASGNMFRIYDPYLGRFLSADPVLQDPLNMQSFNRYSYVWNNPLSFVDPSGNYVRNSGNPNNSGGDFSTGTGNWAPREHNPKNVPEGIEDKDGNIKYDAAGNLVNEIPKTSNSSSPDCNPCYNPDIPAGPPGVGSSPNIGLPAGTNNGGGPRLIGGASIAPIPIPQRPIISNDDVDAIVDDVLVEELVVTAPQPAPVFNHRAFPVSINASVRVVDNSPWPLPFATGGGRDFGAERLDGGLSKGEFEKGIEELLVIGVSFLTGGGSLRVAVESPRLVNACLSVGVAVCLSSATNAIKGIKLPAGSSSLFRIPQSVERAGKGKKLFPKVLGGGRTPK